MARSIEYFQYFSVDGLPNFCDFHQTRETNWIFEPRFETAAVLGLMACKTLPCGSVNVFMVQIVDPPKWMLGIFKIDPTSLT